jgi:hypothetical protein
MMVSIFKLVNGFTLKKTVVFPSQHRLFSLFKRHPDDEILAIVEENFKNQAQTLARIERTLTGMDAKFDAKFDKVNETLTGMHSKFDAKFDKVDARFDKVNEKVDILQLMIVGLYAGIIVAVSGFDLKKLLPLRK